jgi:protein-export membrane protein SecD
MYYSRPKIIGIVVSLLIALVLALPNVLPSASQTYLKDNLGLKPMTLGLDLQGGAYVLLEIDQKDLIAQLLQQQVGDIRSTLREAKIGYSNVQKGQDSVSVRITKPEDVATAKERLGTLLSPQQGGLFSTGVATNLFQLSENNGQFTLSVDPAGLDAKMASAVKQTLEILKRRLDGLGTTEASVQQQGRDRIIVQFPGLQDTTRLKELLSGTAKLMFHLLCDEQPTGPNQNPPPDCVSYPLKEDVDRLHNEKDAAGAKVTDGDLKSLPQMWVQTSTRATVDGEDLNDAQPSFDQSSRPVVTFRFNSKGAARFAKLTSENVGRPFAIVLDGIVQSAPRINEPIVGGSGQISGNFTVQESGDLAIILRSGALPAKLTIVEERTVGPSLGSDSIKAGLIASLVGLVGVMAFMFLPYGLFGLFANLALLGNLLLLIAVMSFFGFTLTLPGIAGIVLTLGMAVDSNVLIYERIREEWRNGRTALNAIETGFKAALGTVLDANITTLIAAVVLFGIGSGPIRGFAITLAVGIFTTMFTAFTLTRLLVSLWVRWKRPKEINL